MHLIVNSVQLAGRGGAMEQRNEKKGGGQVVEMSLRKRKVRAKR